MKINQIRNATIVVEYAGKKFLIDPMLAGKGAYPPFPHSPLQENNPLHNLPMSIEDIIKDIDAVIVTHLHEDHWDDTAKEVLPKEIKLFVQNEEDAEQTRNDGFLNVEIMTNETVFEGIQLIKTQGEHGRGEYVKLLGHVSGVVFKHQDEKTLYLAGDTVWYRGVQEEIDMHKPAVIIVNSGANQFVELESGPIIMDKEDIYEVHKAAPEATIICVHMEAVNHWGLSRETLKNFVKDKGFLPQVLIPADGEAYSI
ncbi:MBL fold metallo-hydrolase [Priestia megaterium]|uniref:MBL fold metallo-hydrolase n=1 Tax=Priestia megaterium TaxID=1404 RepID=UPI002E1B68C8|nr:MBL fold metallo-hydrolase [Priestia megaterium]